jgi:hypothetical protein
MSRLAGARVIDCLRWIDEAGAARLASFANVGAATAVES